MGLGGINLWQLLIILLIIVVIFGTKKLRTLGGDLGGAVKGFRKAMGEAEDDDKDEKREKLDQPDAEFSEAHGSESQPDRNHTS